MKLDELYFLLDITNENLRIAVKNGDTVSAAIETEIARFYTYRIMNLEMAETAKSERSA